MSEKKSLKQRRKELMAEYGAVFICTSLSIFILEMVVLVSLIELMGWSAHDLATRLGLEIEIPESSGTLAMAYLITRALKIPQLLLTAAITPYIAKRWRQWRGTDSGSATPAGHQVAAIPVTEPQVESSDG